MAASSTRPLLEHVWGIEKFTPALLADLFRCSEQDAMLRREQLARQHADRAWVENTVDGLSVPALAVLSILAAHGGMAHVVDIEAIAHVRFGISVTDITAGAAQLVPQLLIIPLMSPQGRAFALVAPSAERIAERVTGLDTAVLTPGTIVPSAKHDGGRSVIAMCAALAQVDLKLTTQGMPHRGAVKRLAKLIGLDEATIDTCVIAGFELGLLHANEEDGVLRPDRDALLAAAEGRFPDHPMVDELLRTLVAGAAPVPIPAIHSWMDTCAYRGFTTMHLEQLARLPGFCEGMIGAVPVLVSCESPTATAASITPSFEVFLPPEARLSDLARLLLVSELTRIDRAIVARITKSSIAKAAAAGASADELVDMLTRASRTPLPQNVAAAVREWATEAVYATIATGRIVVVPPADEARTVTALGSFSPRILAPGVLLVSETLPERTITAALAKLGITSRSSSPTAGAGLVVRPAARDVPRIPPLVSAPAALRARVAAFRNGDLAERRRVPVLERGSLPPARSRVAPSRPADSLGAPEFDVSAQSEALVQHWEKSAGVTLDVDTYDALALAVDRLPVHDGRFLLAPSSLDVVLARLEKLLARPDRFQSFPEALVARIAALLGVGQASSGGAGDRRDELEWHRDHIDARLEAASRTQARVVLDLGTRIQHLCVARLSKRGTTWMVLGEDEDGNDVAVRISDVRGVADAPAPKAPVRWQPLEGMPIPSGHVPCPCGSGRRYRQCCRIATA